MVVVPHSVNGTKDFWPTDLHPMNVFISLTLIVKDGAATLERSLASIRDLVDEIVVVDTGSSDHSKDIALQHGAREKWCQFFFSCLRFRKGVSWRPGWSKRHRDWDRSWCRVAVAVLVKPSKKELTPFFLFLSTRQSSLL